MESLRMSPPVFCSFRKVLKDFEYEGFLIPKGWQIIWAACMTHMEDCIFPNASKLDPTHFDKQAPAYSFMAFGGGPRICPGNEFARIETLVTIHYLVTPVQVGPLFLRHVILQRSNAKFQAGTRDTNRAKNLFRSQLKCTSRHTYFNES
ncbi:cytochrome P450, putative [Ricinus communis]|uniref:Cytochrome P450, putative n=1 Tax=Ricinus communis TaxID=3988 RepID=B9RXN4_RICCO|nr:cytochrome P450, putative [Ricinus communis]